jgi:RNA polymerase sigma-70 factor (ECF subfamily)
VGPASANQPVQECSDLEIVDKVRKGDREAFEILYERYFKRIYRFIDRRMGIRADVEETTQEVFIAVFSCLDSYRGEAPFSAWIFGVTRRVIASRFKRKRHPTVPLMEEDSESNTAHASTRPTPLEEYECQERIEEMSSAAHKLTDEQRMLFRLHHIDDRPPPPHREKSGTRCVSSSGFAHALLARSLERLGPAQILYSIHIHIAFLYHICVNT